MRLYAWLSGALLYADGQRGEEKQYRPSHPLRHVRNGTLRCARPCGICSTSSCDEVLQPDTELVRLRSATFFLVHIWFVRVPKNGVVTVSRLPTVEVMMNVAAWHYYFRLQLLLLAVLVPTSYRSSSRATSVAGKILGLPIPAVRSTDWAVDLLFRI